jgi:hypothetical protein
MITYKFDEVPEHEVLVCPHGNHTTGNKPYYRTASSVRKNLTSALTLKSPKEAIDDVTEYKGGLLKASSVGQLPRNRKQAYNLKQGTSSKSAGTVGKDLLYVMMAQCKQAEKNERFVQEVTCAPEPMAILCTDQQLGDMERFCCDPNEFAIMGIDPTFNLGDFNVTPIVYQHLLVEHRRSGQSPWMLGPILIHYKKEFRNYNFFLSALIGLQPTLAHVRAVGTDGEVNLIRAVQQQFNHALQLRCFRHLQGNIERHLQALKIPVAVIRKYVLDIFGTDDEAGVHHEGLVDSIDVQEFDERLRQIQPVWAKREEDIQVNINFHAWFSKYKANDVRSGALREIREAAGLDSPPKAYYTNANESINRVLKDKVNWKKKQLPQFNAEMKQLVAMQQRDVEKALIDEGEYTLRPQYKHLEISEPGRWWRMTEDQRARHLLNFRQFRSEKASASKLNKGKQKKDTQSSKTAFLSVSVDEAKAIIPNIPEDTLEGIWNKASELLANTLSMSHIPGGSSKDRFVLSRSGSKPHAVTAKQTRYICDTHCLHFQSLSLCSHTVAVAQANGATDLRSFLGSICGTVPNLLSLGKHGLPPGAGKKGNRPPRKKSTKVAPISYSAEFLATETSSFQFTPGENKSLSVSTTAQHTPGSPSVSTTVCPPGSLPVYVNNQQTPGPSSTSITAQHAPGPSSLSVTTPEPSSLSVTTPGPSSLSITTPGVSSVSVTTQRWSPSSISVTTPGTSSVSVTTPGPSSVSITTPVPSSVSVTTPVPSSVSVTTPGPSSSSYAGQHTLWPSSVSGISHDTASAHNSSVPYSVSARYSASYSTPHTPGTSISGITQHTPGSSSVFTTCHYTPGPSPILYTAQHTPGTFTAFSPSPNTTGTSYPGPPMLATFPQNLGYHTIVSAPPPPLHTPGTLVRGPYLHKGQSAGSSNPVCYIVMFLSGNITTCFGCRLRFNKPPIPPFDLVVQHKDFRSYVDADGQQRQKYGNVYYHVNKSCILRKAKNFSTADMIVSQEVIEKALPEHAELLLERFGLRIM